jgi:DNA-binding response OmpR family regulator
MAKVIPFRKGIRHVPEARSEVPGNKITILVVEDHESLCEMLSLYFMRYGYHVRTATDGETALSILKAEEIHLVLLDLMLPRIDGYGVLKWIREHSSGALPYVIVVSAGNVITDRISTLQLGADEYLAKPFHLIRLLERIQRIEKSIKI